MPPLPPDQNSYSTAEVTALLAPLLEENRKLKLYSRQLAQHIEDAGGSASSPADPPADALAELREVSRHIDKAINDIITRAQKIDRMLASYLFPEKQKLIDELTRIMEACNVHDITTQRLYKVRGLLGDKDIPENYKPRVTGNATACPLESGPQMPADAITQAEIDRLMQS